MVSTRGHTASLPLPFLTSLDAGIRNQRISLSISCGCVRTSSSFTSFSERQLESSFHNRQGARCTHLLPRRWVLSNRYLRLVNAYTILAYVTGDSYHTKNIQTWNQFNETESVLRWDSDPAKKLCPQTGLHTGEYTTRCHNAPSI